MNVFKPYYFSLISYLNLVDSHYVEGRFLWLNHAFNGAGNLLWMSFEQLIKALIVQSQIEKELIDIVTIRDINGKKEKIKFDLNEKDITTRAKVLDSLFYQIDFRHNLDSLLKRLNETAGIDLSDYKKCLLKINEFFKRRYVVHEGTSIDPNMLDEIDKLFFYLRSFVSVNINRTFIDELIFRKKYNIQEPVPFFMTLFFKNNFIVARQYDDVIDRIPDGRVIAHNGIKFKEFPKEGYEELVKKGYLIHVGYMTLKMRV